MMHELKMIDLYIKKYSLKKLHIAKYCELAHITRSAFYHRYSNLTGFFKYVLETMAQECMCFEKKTKFGFALQNTLEHVYEYGKVYLWIYRVTTFEEHKILRKAIINVIRKNVMLYAMMNEGISTKRLDKVTQGLYDHFLSLILNNCEDKFLDVFQLLNNYLPEVEGHRFQNTGLKQVRQRLSYEPIEKNQKNFYRF